MRVDVPGLARARVCRELDCSSRRRPCTSTRPPILRLDAPQSVGTSPSARRSRRRPATSSRSSRFGPGVFRLRVGPNTQARLRPRRRRARKRARSRRETDGTGTFTAGRRDARDRRRAAALPPVCIDGDAGARRRSPTSIFAAGRACRRSAACARAASGPRRSRSPSGEPVYGLGEKFGPLDKRGQLIHSQVVDALGVNTGLVVQERAVRVEPGHGQRRAGACSSHTPAMVTHGVGHPDWSHRSLRGAGRRRGARPLPVRGGHAARDRRSLHAAHRARAPVPRWSLGLWVSRAYYKTPEEAATIAAKLRERKIPCDVLTLDGRAAWNVETRFDFQWDPERVSRSARRARDDQGARSARSASGNIPYVSIHSPLFEELAARGYLLTDARRRSVRVRLGHVARDEPVRRRADAAAGERHRRLHATRTRTRGGATRTQRCSTTAST